MKPNYIIIITPRQAMACDRIHPLTKKRITMERPTQLKLHKSGVVEFVGGQKLDPLDIKMFEEYNSCHASKSWKPFSYSMAKKYCLEYHCVFDGKLIIGG